MFQALADDILKNKFSSSESIRFYSAAVTKGLADIERQVFDKYLKKEGRCLLLGCGAGREVIPLVGAGFEVVGLDLVEGLIFSANKLAEKKGIKLQLLVGDMRCLMFKDNTFDTVIFAAGIIQLLSQKQKIEVLTEAKNLLRKNGSIILCVDNNNYYFAFPYSFWPLFELVLKMKWKIRKINKGPARQIKQVSKVLFRPFVQSYFLIIFNILTIYFPSFFIDLIRGLKKRIMGKFYKGFEPGQRFIRKSFLVELLSGLPITFYRFKDVKKDIKESNMRLVDYMTTWGSYWGIDNNLPLPNFLKIRSPWITYVLKDF
ncbi:MAG: class I SAM-dependent methyltransferase [Candidatus Omnitrophota bacterium]|nr:class I SAM-dependent methyltransferase [Candidatus Omnitrophota bacterium]